MMRLIVNLVNGKSIVFEKASPSWLVSEVRQKVQAQLPKGHRLASLKYLFTNVTDHRSIGHYGHGSDMTLRESLDFPGGFCNEWIPKAPECSICSDQLIERRFKTECGHTFHEACLMEWMTHKKTCPLCSTEL
jgi:hypothetical protein